MTNAEQHQQTLEQAKHALDGAIGLGALSSPWWLSLLENGLGLFMLVGGAVLLGLRIYIAAIEACEKRKKLKKGH